MGVPESWGFDKLATRNVILAFMVISVTVIPIMYGSIRSMYNDRITKLESEKIALQIKVDECNANYIKETNRLNSEMRSYLLFSDSLYRSDARRVKSITRFIK